MARREKNPLDVPTSFTLVANESGSFVPSTCPAGAGARSKSTQPCSDRAESRAQARLVQTHVSSSLFLTPHHLTSTRKEMAFSPRKERHKEGDKSKDGEGNQLISEMKTANSCPSKSPKGGKGVFFTFRLRRSSVYLPGHQEGFPCRTHVHGHVTQRKQMAGEPPDLSLPRERASDHPPGKQRTWRQKGELGLQDPSGNIITNRLY